MNRALLGALIYTGLSLVAALIFFFLASGEKYPPVARYGGAGWVFLLTLIILMPVIIPRLKKK